MRSKYNTESAYTYRINKQKLKKQYKYLNNLNKTKDLKINTLNHFILTHSLYCFWNKVDTIALFIF